MSRNLNLDTVLRVRRHQPTRLEGFVDSSFAFAVTLLVISIGHTPSSVPEMLQALRGVPTFALCFLLIARIWAAHRAWSRHYDLEDRRTIQLSLLLVLVVLIYVYPLRLLLSLMFAGLSGNFLAEQSLELASITDLRAAYAVFGIGYAAIGVIFFFLLRHALDQADAIGLNAAERIVTQMSKTRWICVSVVSLFSTLLAYTLPFDPRAPWLYSLPGCVYWLLFASFPVLRRMYARKLSALPASTVPA
jgi:uncharacterized membrane protein